MSPSRLGYKRQQLLCSRYSVRSPSEESHVVSGPTEKPTQSFILSAESYVSELQSEFLSCSKMTTVFTET